MKFIEPGNEMHIVIIFVQNLGMTVYDLCTNYAYVCLWKKKLKNVR